MMTPVPCPGQLRGTLVICSGGNSWTVRLPPVLSGWLAGG